MVARGERVGEVYVRSHVDGRGMDRELAREVEKFNAGKAGAKAGKAYGEKYATYANTRISKGRRKEFQNAIRDAATTAERSTRIFKTKFFRQIEKDIRETFTMRGVADRMIADLRREVERSGLEIEFFDPKKTKKNTDEVAARIDVFLKDLAGKYSRYRDEQERENERATLERLNSERRMYAAIDDLERQRRSEKREREAREFDLQVKALEDEERYHRLSMQRREAAIREYEQSVRRMVSALQRLNRGEANFGETLEQSVQRTKVHLEELRRNLDRIGLDESDVRGYTNVFRQMDRDITRLNPRFLIINRNLDVMATRIGRALGRGSRNDLIHFFGALTENMSRVAFSLPRMAQGVIRFVDAFPQFVAKFSELRAAGTSVIGALRGAAGAGGALGASLATAAVAIPIVVIVVGTLVSAVSMLLGVITALANVISFALVGSLSAVAGALLPVIAGVGVLGGAIASLSDEQKEALKSAIKPFTDGMKEIGRAAADAIFGGQRFKDTIKDMTEAVTSSNMKALITDIADAIGEVGRGWSKALNSKGFQDWLKAMNETVPGQIEKLGQIVENVAGAMGGTFLAMQPLVDRFLGWLERITAEWSEWANSAEGQREMLDFFQRAGDSAKALGGFIGEVSGLMKDLLFSTSGNEAGVSIFADMEGAIRKFRDYIADGGLEKWFKDAKDFADDLGAAIKGIADLLDALDSSGFRSFAGYLFNMFGDLADAIAFVVDPIADLVSALVDLITLDFSGFGSNLMASLGGILKGLVGFPLKIVDALFGTNFTEAIFDFFGSIDFGKIGSAIIEGIGKGLSGALGALTEILTPVADTIGAIFTGAFSAASTVLSTVANLITSVVVGAFDALVTAAQAVYNFFSPILIPMFSIFESLVGIVAAVLTGVFNAAMLVVKGTAEVLSAIFEATVVPAFELVKDVASTVADFFTAVFDLALGLIIDTATTLANLLSGPLNTAFTVVKDIATALKDLLSGALDKAFGTIYSAAKKVGDFFSGVFHGALSAVKTVIDAIGRALEKVADFLDWVKRGADKVAKALGKIKVPNIKLPDLTPWDGLLPGFASGGILTGPMRILAGEAGPEAIVPLNRPLSQVDPAVRGLSAIAQGKASAGMIGGGKSVDASGWTIVTPSRNPETVAHEVLNELVGRLI